MFYVAASQNKTIKQKDEFASNKSTLNQAEMLKGHEKASKLGDPKLSKDVDASKKDDKGGSAKEEKYDFLHAEFKWRMDGNTSYVDAAGILRQKYGIGLSFTDDEYFADELLISNKITAYPKDKPKKDETIDIPASTLLSDDLYSPPTASSPSDLTGKETEAKDAMTEVETKKPAGSLKDSNLESLENIKVLANDFKKDINNDKFELKELYAKANEAGRALWTYCATNVGTIHSADMLLFVGRNLMRSYIKETANPKIIKDKRQITHLIYQLEQGSRNLDPEITTGAKIFNVLLAGFDPFKISVKSDFVNNNGNTASYFALKYNGKTLNINGKKVMFHTQVFPVTGNDFEEGIVEGFYRDRLDKVDMVINTGIGDRGFEIEGRAQNKYSKADLDNNNMSRGKRGTGKINPDDPKRNTYSNTLATHSELKGLNLLTPGSKDPWEPSIEYDDAGRRATAGNFFCNEIFYRVSDLQKTKKTSIPSGFIHLPVSAYTDKKKRNDLSGKYEKILKEILNLRIPSVKSTKK